MIKIFTIRQILEKHLLPREEFIYGFADLRNIIDESFGNYHYGISIGKKLDDKIVNGIYHGPTLEYYQHYRDINQELALITAAISEDLRKEGIETQCLEPTVTTHELDTVYAKDLTVKVSHKMVATRAGLGWIGKSDLFISNTFGPRLRLVSMLTDVPLKSDAEPVVKSRCGHCKICMNRCPANAINGKTWDVNVKREEFFDAFKCRAKCWEMGQKYLNMDAGVCGICVAVCPFGW